MKDSVNNNERKFTLPRSRILRRRESIQRLFQSGKAVRERHLDLRYVLDPDQPGICLMGFIAGKRLGKAHERNTIKRRMREAYRLHQHLISDLTDSAAVGFQGIFIAKKTGTSFATIEKECVRLLKTVRRHLQNREAS